MTRLFTVIIYLGPLLSLTAQTWTGTQLSINHPTLGENGDNTSFFRVDPYSDFTNLRLRLGDEESSNFEIGYNFYSGGQWFTNFSLDGYGTGYFRGKLGLGTTSPGAKLSFNNLDDGTNGADGITWYNPSPLVYGIFRTAGAWAAPDYQQLKISFDTGIILDPGSLYGKSYVDVKGAGLRVSSGNVGIGTTTPATKLHVDINNLNNDYSQVLTGIYTRNTNATDNNYNGLSFGDASGWGVAGVIAQVKSHANHTAALSFFTRKNGVAPSPQMTLDEDGNVGIGTTTPDSKLTVKGIIHSQEVKVDLNGSVAPDYVFEKGYPLTSLEELKSYIDQNKHLPEIPSAKEMQEEGINLKEMNLLLLKKVEELTLHIIEQDKRLRKLEGNDNE